MKELLKSCLTAGLIMLEGQGLFAQNVQLTWGKPVEAGRKMTVSQMLGQDESGFYALVSNSKGLGSLFRSSKIFLEHCDNSANVISTKQLTFPSPDGKETKFQDLLKTGSNFYLFTSYYNKSQDMNYAFYTKVDKSGTTAKTFEKIDEIQAEKKRNAGSFTFVASNDSSKILAYHNDPYEKKEPESFNFKVYDRDMKLLWEKHVELPYRDKDVNIFDVMVSNSGRVYLLAKYQVGVRAVKNGDPNYKFFVLSYNKTDNKYKQFDIDLDDFFISDINVDIDPSDNLLCAGFYSNKSANGIAGSFYVRIDGEKTKILSKKIQAFDSKTLEQFMTKRKAKKGKELVSYVIRKPIIRQDGGIVLVAEQYYVVQVTTYDKNGGSHTDYYYHYNTILVTNIKPDGTIAWVKAIPKFQVSKNDGGPYSSFASCVYKDKMYFIYNDNKKNVANTTETKKLRACGNFKKSVATLAVLDNDGNLTKAGLMNNKDTKHMYLRPKISLQASANSVILFGEKRNDYRYGIVKFE